MTSSVLICPRRVRLMSPGCPGSIPSWVWLTPSQDRLPTVSAAEALLDFEENEGTFIPTGIPDLDAVLGSVLDQDESGDGGIQRGQVTEIWGPPGSGKTAFGYVCGPDIHDSRLKLTCLCSVQLAAHCLRDGGEVVWVGPSLSLSQRRVSLHLLTSIDFTHRVSFERMRHVVGAAIGTQDEDATLAFLDMVTYYMFDSLPHFVAQICRPTWHVPPATALIVIDSLSALLTYAFPREDDTEDPGAPGAPGKPPGPAPPGDAKDKKSWLALLSDSVEDLTIPCRRSSDRAETRNTPIYHRESSEARSGPGSCSGHAHRKLYPIRPRT